MQAMFVWCELASPLIVTDRPPMLDAILAAELFDRLGDVERALQAVPIARTSDGIPHASMMLYGEYHRPALTQVSLFKSFARDLNATPTDMAPLPLPARVDLGRGDFQNEFSTYWTADLTCVRFVARGDVAAVRTLMSGISFLGKQRSRGFGQVAAVRVEPLDGEDPLFGIVGAGRLLRPVPQRFAARLPTALRTGAIEDRTWKNPFNPWHGGITELCRVPDFMLGEPIDTPTFAKICGLPD